MYFAFHCFNLGNIDLKIEFNLRPAHLNRRLQNRGEVEKEKLFLSGKNLNQKIADFIQQLITEGYAVKSVVPEKKDLYNLYSDLMSETKN